MAITALPQATVHLLGSAQVLTTPTSLIKELLDNALDAKATSVDILIAANTIDKIEVRDNGHGIAEEDFDSLGRRGCTSKLRSFSELKSVGGISLGFRGEALASAVQLGQVSVTTKFEGAAVATTVKLKAPGGVGSQSRTSHPVGTTVSVLNFMSGLPVRRQTALKNAQKTLGHVKDLLQAYALARPHIRFSLKVTKGPSKGSWSFAPRPNDGIKEAVAAVIGRDAAMQCIEKSLSFPEKGYRDEDEGITASVRTDVNAIESSLDQFVVEVFLPKPGADASKIGHRQYISIDSRPVSHEKGTMRRIVSIFKHYVQDSISDTSEKVKNPFLRLNVKCPVASYDPNVEPAKDDVLFGNEHVVLESIENLFRSIYGDRKVTLTHSNAPATVGKKLDSFELLLARKGPNKPTLHPTIVEGAPSPEAVVSPPSSSAAQKAFTLPVKEDELKVGKKDKPDESLKRRWNIDMSDDLSEEVERYKLRDGKQVSIHARSPSTERQMTSSRSLNPWVAAKMTAPVRQDDFPSLTGTMAKSNPPSLLSRDFLPTPRSSADASPKASDQLEPSSPLSRPRQTFRNGDVSSLVLPAMGQSPERRAIKSAVEDLAYPSPRRSLTAGPDEILLEGDDAGMTKRSNDFISARDVLDPSSMPPPPFRQRGPKKSQGLGKAVTSETGKADGHRQTTLCPPRRAIQDSNQCSSGHDHASKDAWAMDYERRKEEATLRRRAEIRAERAELRVVQAQAATTDGIPSSSAHKNRYNAAIAALEANQRSDDTLSSETFKTTLPDSDPRAYFMKRQMSSKNLRHKSGQGARMMRAKSSRLPLEVIPDQQKLHMLVRNDPAGMESIRKVTMELARVDTYIARGDEAAGLLISKSESMLVAGKVQASIERWIEAKVEGDCEIEYQFENLVGVQHGVYLHG